MPSTPNATRPTRASTAASALVVLLVTTVVVAGPVAAAATPAATQAPTAETAGANFEVTLQSTNSPVTEGETMEFKVSVENTGEETGTQVVTLSVAEEQRDSRRLSLEPTELTTFTLTWETGDGDAGNYTAEIASENDSVRPDVRVNAPKSSNFQVEIASTNAPVDAGERLTVDVRVANVGDLPGNETVTLSVGAVERDSTTLSLDPGEATTVTLSWQTGQGDGGNYTATVASPNDTAETDVTVVGENRPPDGNISVEPSPPVAGETTILEADASDPDGNITTYVWRVDGEVVSREATLEHTFEEPGSHEVALTMTDDDGASTTITRTVQVNVAPEASFSVGNDHPNPNEQVTFNATASDPDGNVSRYEWRVDGELVETDATLEHRFESGGEHEVTLTVIDDDGTNVSVTRTVTVNRAPEVNISMVTEKPKTGKTVQFRVNATDPDGSVVSYTWRVDAAVEGENRSFSHVFPHPGEHEVTLTVTDDDGATATHSITVNIKGSGPSSNAGTPTESTSIPGFGLLAGLIAFAVVGALWVGGNRRRDGDS